MGKPSTVDMAAKHFRDAAATVGPKYVEGVKGADWAGPAGSDNAEQNYATAISRVVAGKLRQLGVQKVSNAQWAQAAETKGGPIIGSRMAAADGKYRAKWGPIYEQVLGVVSSLPPRTTDFNGNIQNRLVAVVKAWKHASGKSG